MPPWYSSLPTLLIALSVATAVSCSGESPERERWQFASDKAADTTSPTDSGPHRRTDTPDQDAEAGPDADRRADTVCWLSTPVDELRERCEPTGPDDTDEDGLADDRERELCGGEGTETDQAYTDDDRLSDCREVELGTDPCDPDTDADGLTDGLEAYFCLDPTDPGDPTPRDAWFRDACERRHPRPLEVELAENRLWQYVRVPAIDRFSTIDYDGSGDAAAMAVFAASSPDARGAVTSFAAEAEPSNIEPLELMDRRVEPALEEVGDIDQVTDRGPFPAGKMDASLGTYRISLSDGPVSPTVLRNRLAHDLQPAADEKFADLPADSGTAAEEFRVAVGLNQDRLDEDCRTSSRRFVFLALAVTPLDDTAAPGDLERLVEPRLLKPGNTQQTEECLRYSHPSIPGSDRTRTDDDGNLRVDLGYPQLDESFRVTLDGRLLPRGEDLYSYDREKGILQIDESARSDDRDSLELLTIHMIRHIDRCRAKCTVEDCRPPE